MPAEANETDARHKRTRAHAFIGHYIIAYRATTHPTPGTQPPHRGVRNTDAEHRNGGINGNCAGARAHNGQNEAAGTVVKGESSVR